MYECRILEGREYGMLDINKNMHGCCDQKNVTAREQTMKVVEEKSTRKKGIPSIPGIQVRMVENLKKGIT